MSIRERSERKVEETVCRLEDEYEEFTVVEKTWEHSGERYDNIGERFEQGTLGGAGVWLTNENGEVLLVRNEGDKGWGDPGGKAEVGESYEATAKREVKEETGAECRLTGLCDVHIIENQNAESDDPSVFELIVTFHGELNGGELRPREGEIAEMDWFAKPPENVLFDEIRTRPYPA
ncbi:NUDIX hydrolase [Halopelagius fulvigenes]|uniref:NUDIX hydrolase n=1 Tax=Halopelagius fulvigenes TaxID=1198324 RepID=A0ABD5U5E7_9EURY